ncbi:MAG TPA: PA2779 family protein [Longimicrobiales bacterium]|nr:PA2779 family protein [Longimicrobiales bacterium]
MRRSFAATLAIAAAFVFAPPASAQQAGFGGSAEGVDQGEDDRSTIMRFLERDEVGGAAAGIGVDIQAVGRDVQNMDDASAARVAQEVRDVEQQMAAQNITITTTALIIGLLILIVLILVL